MGGSSKMGVCRKCNRERLIKARGLCSPCYADEMAREKALGANGDAAGLQVTVDFSLAPHILQGLRLRAEDDMRPLGNQIVWELKRAEAAVPVLTELRECAACACGNAANAADEAGGEA